MSHLSSQFKNIPALPAAGCEARVFAALRNAHLEAARRARQYSFVGFGISVILAASGIVVYGADLFASEFWSLLSLVFSDGSIILQALPDYMASLLETLPIIPLLVLFAPLTLFLWSLAQWSTSVEGGRGLLGYFERVT